MKDYKEEPMKDYEVTKVQAKDTFKVCPSCGYEDGFHAMFEGRGTDGVHCG